MRLSGIVISSDLLFAPAPHTTADGNGGGGWGGGADYPGGHAALLERLPRPVDDITVRHGRDADAGEASNGISSGGSGRQGGSGGGGGGGAEKLVTKSSTEGKKAWILSQWHSLIQEATSAWQETAVRA